MLERAVAAGLPCRWVAADSVYGWDYALRLWLESQPLGYVLAVTSKKRAPMGFDTVKERAASLTATDWQRMSAGDGVKGPRLYDLAQKTYKRFWWPSSTGSALSTSPTCPPLKAGCIWRLSPTWQPGRSLAG